MDNNEQNQLLFLDEVTKRTGSNWDDLGFDQNDVERWLSSADTVEEAATNLIVNYGLEDLSIPFF